MRVDQPIPERTMDAALGLEGFTFDGEARARLRMPVRDDVRQPFGIVHGGAFAALAESVCSRATWEAVGPELGAFGQSNHSTFLRPASTGTIEARAEAVHRGRTSWVWEVRMHDDEDRLCAIARVLIAVRSLERS